MNLFHLTKHQPEKPGPCAFCFLNWSWKLEWYNENGNDVLAARPGRWSAACMTDWTRTVATNQHHGWRHFTWRRGRNYTLWWVVIYICRQAIRHQPLNPRSQDCPPWGCRVTMVSASVCPPVRKLVVKGEILVATRCVSCDMGII